MGILSDPRFQKRLKLYGFGFFFGVLLVIFLFKDRFPGPASVEEVRSAFRKDTLLIADSLQHRLDSLKITPNEFKDSLASGKFLLPTRKSADRKTYHVRTEGPPAMKVRLEVLEEKGTRAEKLVLLP